MNAKQDKGLHLCQVNVSGLSQKSKIAIDRFNYKYKVDILALQETLLNNSKSNLRSFHYLDTFSINNDRGVSISVAPRMGPQQIHDLQDSHCDALWVSVKVNSTVLMIGNIYVNLSATSPNNLSACLRNIQNAFDYCNKYSIKDILIVGDFNSRHISWGDTISNNNGKELAAFIGQHNLTCITPNTQTFVTRNGGSVIDLALMKGKLSNLYHSSSVDDCTELFTGAPTRGHLPILHQFKCPANANKVNLHPHWDLDNTNWKEWRTCLNNNMLRKISSVLHTYTEPARLWSDFVTVILDVNKQCIPIKKVCTHSKPFWNSLLTDLSIKLQVAQNNMKKSFTPSNVNIHDQAKEEFSRALIVEKNKWIHRQLEHLNVPDSVRFWKNYKRIFTEKGNEYMGNLIDNGVLYSERVDKENVLFKSFFSGEHMSGGDFDLPFEDEILNEYDSIASGNYLRTDQDPTVDEHLNGDISLTEVISALKLQKATAKSFDTDELHPRILKRLPTAAIQIIRKLFNLVLDTGVWVWDVSNVTFIKKDGKDNYMKPSAYRPITISSYIGKLFEKILERRIRLHCEIEGLLDEEQEGFRSERNTSRYLYKLVAALDECKRKKLTTFLLCIDFSKAFDSIWIKGLIVKLYRYQFQGKILRVINNFLLSRTIRLKVDNILGHKRACGLFGLPQGSVLAPLLFIIYLSDMLCRNQLPLPCQTFSSLFKYADDGTIAVSHTDPNSAHYIMEQMCKYLHIWCSKWKLIPNCEKNKTECLIIFPTSSDLDVSNFTTLKIGTKSILYTAQSKVLGLIIDDELSFNCHARSKLKQCWFAWHSISKKCNRSKGLNASSLRMLFKAIVLTKLLYAAPIWLGQNLDTFRDFYARVLLKISGATHHPPKNITSAALNIPPLEISYQIMTIKFIIKALTADSYMQGLIIQLEEARAHRYYPHIDLTRRFVSWKINNPNMLHRSKLNLLECFQDSYLQYTKGEMTTFLDILWNDHLQRSLQHDIQLLEINEKSKRLFPRHSSRSTDTKVMSLLHGHDLCFRAFNSRVTGNCTPHCSNCPTRDTHIHRIFTCPLYNSSFRDVLQQHSHHDSPCWAILQDCSEDTVVAFRSLAQLSITDNELHQS